jgi:hypothetical protein
MIGFAFDKVLICKYSEIRILCWSTQITGRRLDMATVSFDKNIIIDEPDAVDKLVDSLLYDEPRKINKQLASPTEMAKGEKLLEQCLSRSKSLRS